MKKLVLALMLLLAMFGLSQCQETWTWRQRVTVTVATSEGLRAGSGVICGSLTETRWGPSETVGARADVAGEAIVIPLTDGRTVLISARAIPSNPQNLLPDLTPVHAAKKLEEMSSMAMPGYPAAALRLDELPSFIVVNQSSASPNLEEIKSKDTDRQRDLGIRIVSVNIKTTNEAITLGATKILVDKGARLDRATVRTGLPPQWMPNFVTRLTAC